MSAPVISVIIPTHKRATTLKECLMRLERQTIAEQLEVIVVSDGHDDDTVNIMSALQKKGWAKDHVRFYEIEKSQQGTARNRGVKEARADVVLFIGDDIFLAPDACEIHMKTHRKQQATSNKTTAVLGFTTWDSALTITPAMKWLEKSGWQFGYPMLARFRHACIPSDMQHRFTYTSHISIPTSIAKRYSFREDLTLYGWEDILWGQQLRDVSIHLYYEPDAVGFHHHEITLEDSLERIETLGRSLLHLTKVAPEFDRRPKGYRLWWYRINALLPTMRGKHAKAFLKGLSDTGRT